MPRLLAGGPGLAVSPDHALLAVAGSGRITLHDAATHAETATTAVASAECDVTFVATGGVLRLVAFVRRESGTEVRSFSVPDLAPAGQLELEAPARPLAVVGERIVCADDAGERARLIAVGARALAGDVIALREPVQFAVATPEDRLLVSARDQVESWDVLLRRAMQRLNLPVQKPRQAGFASRKRLLWIATQQQLGVYRYSDGRLQLRVDLGKRFLAADGHGDSSRVVVALHPEGEPIELVAFDLALRERKDLAGGHPASFCVVEGAAPSVVTADADARLRFEPLGEARSADAAIAPDRPRPRTATPPVVMRTPDGGRRLKDPADWRARLSHPEAPAQREAARAEPEPAREPEPQRAPEAARGDIPWRTSLASWAQLLLDGRQAGPAPIGPDSPLDALAQRSELDEAARRALALLYGARLCGRPDVPSATVARALGDTEDAWQEALGHGVLSARGLALSRAGCLRLRLAAARELDGKADAPPT